MAVLPTGYTRLSPDIPFFCHVKPFGLFLGHVAALPGEPHPKRRRLRVGDTAPPSAARLLRRKARQGAALLEVENDERVSLFAGGVLGVVLWRSRHRKHIARRHDRRVRMVRFGLFDVRARIRSRRNRVERCDRHHV